MKIYLFFVETTLSIFNFVNIFNILCVVFCLFISSNLQHIVKKRTFLFELLLIYAIMIRRCHGADKDDLLCLTSLK
jgi:hypothetical protein